MPVLEEALWTMAGIGVTTIATYSGVLFSQSMAGCLASFYEAKTSALTRTTGTSGENLYAAAGERQCPKFLPIVELKEEY